MREEDVTCHQYIGYEDGHRIPLRDHFVGPL